MSAEDDDGPLIDFYPYRARFKTYERFEVDGRDHQSILDELATMAHEEDRIADLGRVSGSIYHGGHDHYAFLTHLLARSEAPLTRLAAAEALGASPLTSAVS